MIPAIAILLAGVLASGPALAEECTVEDWTHSYSSFMSAITVEGVATCKAGEIHLRLYDGEGEGRKLIAVETAYIEGFIFETILTAKAEPAALFIKYSIDED